MNKYLMLFLLFGLSFIYTGCLKDTSVYKLTEAEVITITGLEGDYTVLSGIDRISVKPSVSSNKPGDFEYLWGVYETNVQGYAPVLDTIGRSKDLDYKVDLSAKGWVLVFCVTNTNTGYSQYFTSSLNVGTPFTRGWYVLKDDGTNSDLDLFTTAETIVPETRVDNVFSAVNGAKIPGKARLLNYYNDYKSDILISGKFVNTKAMFVIADKGASVVDINSMEQIRGLDEMFYQPPSVRMPGFVTSGSQGLYFNNAGQLSSIYTMSSNTGQFGVSKILGDQATPYYLSRFFIGSGLISAPIVFDTITSSFITATPSGSTMMEYGNSSTTEMKAQNTHKEVLYMGTTSYYPLKGVAVLRDISDPSLFIISSLDVSDGFNAINDTVSTDKMILKASLFAVNTNENILYFVVGNELWSHNIANNFEKMQFKAPEGESITFVRHRAYSSEEAFSFNYIMIGTKAGDKYKVRMFTKSSGNLAAEPSVTLEGSGEVGDVMYISPSVSGRTYLNSY